MVLDTGDNQCDLRLAGQTPSGKLEFDVFLTWVAREVPTF